MYIIQVSDVSRHPEQAELNNKVLFTSKCMTENLVNVRALSKNVYSHVFEQTVRERTRIRDQCS